VKLIVVFRNFANAAKSRVYYPLAILEEISEFRLFDHEKEIIENSANVLCLLYKVNE
jgi:hypothetical protein